MAEGAPTELVHDHCGIILLTFTLRGLMPRTMHLCGILGSGGQPSDLLFSNGTLDWQMHGA